MEEQNHFEHVISFLPPNVKHMLGQVPKRISLQVEEIRLRAGQPLLLSTSDGEYFINENGVVERDSNAGYVLRDIDLKNTVSLLCSYSFYSYEEEIRNGFITIEGGHRIGMCGECILENGYVRDMRYISFINIRIAHQILGAADDILPHIISQDGRVYHTLIISPPFCGKTTLLRDMARQLSDGIESLGFSGVNVCIVDERSELAASVRGKPSNDVGIRTDVFDRCRKAEGIMMAIRSMAPGVVFADEIGRQEDAMAVEDAVNAGVSVVTSIHGSCFEDFTKRASLRGIRSRIFERYIILSRRYGPGTVEQILDGEGKAVVLCT